MTLNEKCFSLVTCVALIGISEGQFMADIHKRASSGWCECMKGGGAC